MIRAASVLAGNALAFFLAWPAASQAPAAVVLGVEGQGIVHGRALQPRQAVAEGDEVTTLGGSGAKLALAGRAIVIAAADTRFVLDAFRPDLVSLTLTSGLLRLDVPEGAAARYTVAVGGSTAVLQPGGGQWFIAADHGAAQVGVLSGNVTLTGARNRSTQIPARWGTRAEPNLGPMLPRAWMQAEFEGFSRRTACCQAPASGPR